MYMGFHMHAVIKIAQCLKNLIYNHTLFHSFSPLLFAHETLKSLHFIRFVRGMKSGHVIGFDIENEDLQEMERCHGVVVASAIFGMEIEISFFQFFSILSYGFYLHCCC